MGSMVNAEKDAEPYEKAKLFASYFPSVASRLPFLTESLLPAAKQRLKNGHCFVDTPLANRKLPKNYRDTIEADIKDARKDSAEIDELDEWKADLEEQLEVFCGVEGSKASHLDPENVDSLGPELTRKYLAAFKEWQKRKSVEEDDRSFKTTVPQGVEKRAPAPKTKGEIPVKQMDLMDEAQASQALKLILEKYQKLEAKSIKCTKEFGLDATLKRWKDTLQGYVDMISGLEGYDKAHLDLKNCDGLDLPLMRKYLFEFGFDATKVYKMDKAQASKALQPILGKYQKLKANIDNREDLHLIRQPEADRPAPKGLNRRNRRKQRRQKRRQRISVASKDHPPQAAQTAKIAGETKQTPKQNARGRKPLAPKSCLEKT